MKKHQWQTMDTDRRKWLFAGLGAGICSLTGASAFAQNAYPTKPMTLVVPFGAGGTIDVVARSIAQSMSTRLGQPVIVENVPGAGANIGAAKVAASAPDGYTMLVLTTAHTINPSLYAKPGYGLNSFDAVGSIGASPCWLFVGDKSPAKTLQEFVAMMKARPGELTFGSGGSGTTSHLAVELFMRRYGLKATHVPYKSSPQIYTDLIAGTIDFAMNPVTGTDQLVKAGRLRALGVAAESRVTAFPNVPTFTEAGFPGVDVLGWYGLVVPKGVPKMVLTALESALKFAVNDATLRANLLVMGTNTRESSKEEFARYIQAEAKRWSELVAVSGVKAD